MNIEQRKTLALEYLANYDKARDADEAYSKAIKVQFGATATRWTVLDTEFNHLTRMAYLSKINADKAWIDSLAVMREQGVSVNAPEISEALKLETLDRR